MSYKTRVAILFAFSLGFIVGIISIAASMAANVDVSVGVTQFGHQPNGIWYQEGKTTPYTLKMRSPSVSIGLTDRINESWKWRAGWLYLGNASSDAVATASDEDYATRKCSGNPCWPMSHWHGSGDVQGLYSTAVYEVPVGSVVLVGEAGLFVYRPTWSVTIPDWRRCKDCQTEYLKVTHAAKWQPGAVVGVGLKLDGSKTLMISRYTAEASGDEWPAIYHGGATVVSFRVAF